MEFLVGTHFNFLGHRRGAFIISAILIAVGVVSLVIQGGPKPSPRSGRRSDARLHPPN